MIISIIASAVFFSLLNPSFSFLRKYEKEGKRFKRCIYIIIPWKGRLEGVGNPQSSAELALLQSQRCHGACGGGNGDVDGERFLSIQKTRGRKRKKKGGEERAEEQNERAP